jgi:hypothetical protein
MHSEFWWEDQERDHLWRSRRKWGDNIKLDLREVRLGGLD